MKPLNILKVALLAVPLMLSACHSKKTAVGENDSTDQTDVEQQQQFIRRVNQTTQQTLFVTSKLKFSVEVGAQQMTLTGNLKMKRDDVIRLQLMGFGLVEAARLEFTKEDVLVMDRIHKQYLKVPYKYVDFLRNSGINFYTLQALFWNELFQPGSEGGTLSPEMLKKFTANMGGDDVVISLEQGDKMTYSWLASEQTGRIQMANIMYRDTYQGNSQLNWDYRQFEPLGAKLFPSDMQVTLTTPQKEAKLGIKLTYLGTNSDWETRTKVSDKYREVTVDEILRRFMSL